MGGGGIDRCEVAALAACDRLGAQADGIGVSTPGMCRGCTTSRAAIQDGTGGDAMFSEPVPHGLDLSGRARSCSSDQLALISVTRRMKPQEGLMRRHDTSCTCCHSARCAVDVLGRRRVRPRGTS